MMSTMDMEDLFTQTVTIISETGQMERDQGTVNQLIDQEESTKVNGNSLSSWVTNE